MTSCMEFNLVQNQVSPTDWWPAWVSLQMEQATFSYQVLSYRLQKLSPEPLIETILVGLITVVPSDPNIGHLHLQN